MLAISNFNHRSKMHRKCKVSQMNLRQTSTLVRRYETRLPCVQESVTSPSNSPANQRGKELEGTVSPASIPQQFLCTDGVNLPLSISFLSTLYLRVSNGTIRCGSSHLCSTGTYIYSLPRCRWWANCLSARCCGSWQSREYL